MITIQLWVICLVTLSDKRLFITFTYAAVMRFS